MTPLPLERSSEMQAPGAAESRLVRYDGWVGGALVEHNKEADMGDSLKASNWGDFAAPLDLIDDLPHSASLDGPRAALRQAVWEASQHMSSVDIRKYIDGVLDEIESDQP